jgi:hypothetical protein
MSCIPKLLALKGEKEFLKVHDTEDDLSVYLESGGEYKGYHFCVTFTQHGHRCGYVAISNKHPYYKYSDFEDKKISKLKVHGKVNFFYKISERPLVNFKYLGIEHVCDDKWMGFDCGHLNDKPDMETLQKINPRIIAGNFLFETLTKQELFPELYGIKTIKTNKYVEKECKRLIDQLIEAEKQNEKSV